MNRIFLRVSIVISVLAMSAGAAADPASATGQTDNKIPVSAKPAAVDERYQADADKPRDPKAVDPMPASAAPVDSVPSIHRPQPAPAEGSVVK